jgi:hypothetical protein
MGELELGPVAPEPGDERCSSATGSADESANEERRPIQVRLELFPTWLTETFTVARVDPKPIYRYIFRSSTRFRERNESMGHALTRRARPSEVNWAIEHGTSRPALRYDLKYLANNWPDTSTPCVIGT